MQWRERGLAFEMREGVYQITNASLLSSRVFRQVSVGLFSDKTFLHRAAIRQYNNVSVCVWTERGQSSCQGLLGRHCFQSLPRLWHWNWWQEPSEDTEWATHQGKTYSSNFLLSCSSSKLCMCWGTTIFNRPALSPHPQTAQDISFANVQALFQSLSSRRGCPTTSQSDTGAEEPSPKTDQKSLTINGKWPLTLAGLWLQMIVSVSAGENRKVSSSSLDLQWRRFRQRWKIESDYVAWVCFNVHLSIHQGNVNGKLVFKHFSVW